MRGKYLLALALLIGSSFYAVVRADAPLTTYHVRPDKISPFVRKDTLGALRVDWTINSLDTFEKTGGQFIKAASITTDETQPLTTFGYHPSESELLASYYPITNVLGEFVEIVLDCETNRRAWIKDGTIKSDRIILGGLCQVQENCYVDPFYFQDDKEIEVYPASDVSQSPTLMKANLEPYEDLNLQLKRFKVVHQRGTFIEVDGIGWIKIRDDSGLLIIWPIEDSISGYPR